jgi:CubicO group peptidase (beta-lactamase class C family)
MNPSLPHLFKCPTLLTFFLALIPLVSGPLLRGAQASDNPKDPTSYSKTDFTALSDWIDKKRTEYNLPGMAVAVVCRDEVLMIKSYGFCDLEKKKPINEHTVFPIGSSAKPFTSTLAAVLVSKGLMHWDDPITKYLPYFELNIKTDDPSDQVTIRDLLSHRTGFFHMEIIQKAINWQEDPTFAERPEAERYTRKSLLEEAAGYEPVDCFRKKHNYSNVSMLAAAMAAGQAAGKDWDTVIEEMIFKPMGMNHSSTSITRIHGDHEVAGGHLLEDAGYRPAMLINMDVISPAGGINASASDMTHWLRCLLCDGKYEGKRLIRTEALHELWKVQIEKADMGGMFPGAAYGLGWFITEWNGHKVVEHGGNALGYSANIALIPELGIGYAMLSNALPNPLQVTLSEKIWETLGVGKDGD